MYKIQILISGVWTFYSSHTKLVDAQAQWDRAIAAGTPSSSLQKVGW